MWPYVEDDHMEIGNTGWVSVGEGLFKNMKNGHIIDECGVEYDENGNVVKENTDDNKD